MSNQEIRIALTGGLGNQLFQLAAALERANGRDILINDSLLAPRLNNVGEPELFSFLLPANVLLESNSLKQSKFLGKVSGYVLRSGVEKRGWERLPGALLIIRQIARLLFSVKLRKLVGLSVNSGVGFSPPTKSAGAIIQIGYFQTFKFASVVRVKRDLQAMHPSKASSYLAEFSKLAKEIAPLVVHVRLGDYKAERHFGIPSVDYYRAGIYELWKSGKYGEVWIFSDEPELAKEKLIEIANSNFRWFDDSKLSPAETLELMRHGEGYVIANSTFSWWGAFLSYSENADVIAPSPWFAGMDSPIDLIPARWQTRKAF
jgi:hypothetical protein